MTSACNFHGIALLGYLAIFDNRTVNSLCAPVSHLQNGDSSYALCKVLGDLCMKSAMEGKKVIAVIPIIHTYIQRLYTA